MYLCGSRRAVWTPFLVGVLLGCGACCHHSGPYVPTVGPTDIVERNAHDAFDAWLTKDDAPALRAYHEAIAPARSRQDLVQAWEASATLHAKGADFLEKHVFDKAMREAKWPKDVPPEQMEAAFVEGVRKAAEAWVSAGGK